MWSSHTSLIFTTFFCRICHSFSCKLYFAGYILHCNVKLADRLQLQFDLDEKLTGIKLDILNGQSLLQKLSRAICPGTRNSLDKVLAKLTGFTVFDPCPHMKNGITIVVLVTNIVCVTLYPCSFTGVLSTRPDVCHATSNRFSEDSQCEG